MTSNVVVKSRKVSISFRNSYLINTNFLIDPLLHLLKLTLQFFNEQSSAAFAYSVGQVLGFLELSNAINKKAKRSSNLLNVKRRRERQSVLQNHFKILAVRHVECLKDVVVFPGVKGWLQVQVYFVKKSVDLLESRKLGLHSFAVAHHNRNQGLMAGSCIGDGRSDDRDESPDKDLKFTKISCPRSVGVSNADRPTDSKKSCGKYRLQRVVIPFQHLGTFDATPRAKSAAYINFQSGLQHASERVNTPTLQGAVRALIAASRSSAGRGDGTLSPDASF